MGVKVRVVGLLCGFEIGRRVVGGLRGKAGSKAWSKAEVLANLPIA